MSYDKVSMQVVISGKISSLQINAFLLLIRYPDYYRYITSMIVENGNQSPANCISFTFTHLTIKMEVKIFLRFSSIIFAQFNVLLTVRKSLKLLKHHQLYRFEGNIFYKLIFCSVPPFKLAVLHNKYNFLRYNYSWTSSQPDCTTFVAKKSLMVR